MHCFNIKSIDSETLTTIGKFTILWHQFEKEYFNNNFDYWTIDNVIESKNLHVAIDKLKKLKEIVISRYIDRTRSYACEKNAHINKELVKEIDKFTDSNTPPTLLSTICVIYRIRCNLCHGLKDIKDLNNQKELFEAINDIFLNLKIQNEEK